MIIIFRHAKDDEKAASYDHDAHITEEGAAEVPAMVKRLVKEFGFPSIIICSPFVRARETLKIIRSVLKKHKKFPELKFKIDKRLSRYFTSEQQRNPSIRPDTQKHKPPIYEHIDDFNTRLKGVMNNLASKGYAEKKGPVIWCVSHGLAVKKLLLNIGLNSPESVPALETYPIYYKSGRWKMD